MKLKQIFSIGFLFLLIMGLVFGIIYLRDKNSSSLEEKGLVVIGKAPKFSFTNQYGKTINNDFYKDKIYVVDFFFTSCPTICPIMTTNMVQVQNAFPDNSIGIASFSIDPDNDTPEILKAYADLYGVKNPNWNLLTGSEEQIHTLSNEGFNIYAGKGSEEEGGFEHSGLFALIDKDGNIVSRKDKNGNPIVYYKALEKEGIDMLIEDIKKLKN